ncbi:Multidrug and toxin extrusion (MATE) family efflux pump YdhE/NorM [Candidatus Paraburkholderia schumanniana]|nr:Multidrug and toxin extrusion (MATE) family efflux pump YdhE/NorM [Candidatus Paraburkholderia schumannianae]
MNARSTALQTAPQDRPKEETALPVYWHKRVLMLAFPIVFANLTQPILGAVDTAVAGHLDGPQYLGGVAFGGLVFSFVFWGFGFLRMGTTGLIAQAFGARDRHAFRQAVKITLLWSATGAGGFSIVYWVGGEWIIGRLTDQAVVHAAAMRYLPWAAMLPLALVAGFQLDGVFIGATRTHELMKAMAVSLAVFLLAAWALAGSLGNHGLWLALTLFMVARGITLAVQLPAIECASCAPEAG